MEVDRIKGKGKDGKDKGTGKDKGKGKKGGKQDSQKGGGKWCSYGMGYGKGKAKDGKGKGKTQDSKGKNFPGVCHHCCSRDMGRISALGRVEERAR